MPCTIHSEHTRTFPYSTECERIRLTMGFIHFFRVLSVCFDSRAAVCNFSVWCVSGVRLSKAIVERRCSDDCGFGVVYTCSLPVGKPIGSNDEMSIKQSLLILVYTSPQ